MRGKEKQGADQTPPLGGLDRLRKRSSQSDRSSRIETGRSWQAAGRREPALWSVDGLTDCAESNISVGAAVSYWRPSRLVGGSSCHGRLPPGRRRPQRSNASPRACGHRVDLPQQGPTRRQRRCHGRRVGEVLPGVHLVRPDILQRRGQAAPEVVLLSLQDHERLVKPLDDRGEPRARLRELREPADLRHSRVQAPQPQRDRELQRLLGLPHLRSATQLRSRGAGSFHAARRGDVVDRPFDPSSLCPFSRPEGDLRVRDPSTLARGPSPTLRPFITDELSPVGESVPDGDARARGYFWPPRCNTTQASRVLHSLVEVLPAATT